MPGRAFATYLTYAVATLGQRRAALATTIGLLVLVVCSIPFATYQLGSPDALLPAVTSAAMVAMFVSAAMLRGHYHTTHYAPLAILSIAYSITGLLLIPWMLSFPHVFSPNGFGLAETAQWLWVLWHAAFVLLIAGYVWSDSFFSRKAIDAVAGAEIVRRYAICALAVTIGAVFSIVYFHDQLPVLVRGTQYTPVYHLLVDQLLLASVCVVLATLVARTSLRHTTHLWLGVILAAFAIEIYLNGQVVNARFSVGWYMGFLEAGVWQTLFLFVQLHDSDEQMAAIAADTQTLHEETQRDAMTGLFNRRGYDERYSLALREAAATGASVALLAIDVDHFKAFNDHFGHLAGDEALRSVASVMHQVVNRPTDAVCRIGGDEFVIVLASTDERGAAAVAEKIRSNIARLRIRNAPHVPMQMMSTSIGIAVARGESHESSVDLYARADKALYRAKNLGRNRVVATSDNRDLRIV